MPSIGVNWFGLLVSSNLITSMTAIISLINVNNSRKISLICSQKNFCGDSCNLAPCAR